MLRSTNGPVENGNVVATNKTESTTVSPIRIRLFWIAVASNLIALGILLVGIVIPLHRGGQTLSVALTTVSLVCWAFYFRKMTN